MGRQHDERKAREWAKAIREAARSGQSIRAFCSQRRLNESRFYWWQRKLRQGSSRQALKRGGRGKRADGVAATFALVSEESGQLDAGIELVLADGRRVRIGRGVDEATLRTVLAAVAVQPQARRGLAC
jgi:hypothetical protein